MNVNSSVALKAGLIGAAAGLVVAILGRVPFLGCIIGPLGWLVAVATGVLYVYLASGEGESVNAGDGALGGGLSGAIAGAAQALVSGVLTLLFGAVRATSSLLGGEGGAAMMQAGASVFGVVIAIVVGAIVSAILGAVGGLVYAAIKGQSS